MRKITILCCVLLLTPAIVLRAHAQDAEKATETGRAPEVAKAPEPPAHYYHLEFVIQEVGTDGKPTNSRTYSTTVCTSGTEQFGAIRTGKRVPIITGGSQGKTGDGKPDFQFQYVDVGVSIDTRDVREVGRQLAAHVKAEISSLAESAPSSGSELADDPVIRQNSWQASVIIPIGKPTVVFSSDALDSKGGMQVVVTATPLQ